MDYNEQRNSACYEMIAHSKILEEIINDPDFTKSVVEAASIIVRSLNRGGKIIACGNGGSMSDAMHLCSELTGRYRETRKPIPAMAISDPGHLSCVANDFGYSDVFSRFIEAFGKPGDVLVALSTSGESENVFLAVQAAIHEDMEVVFIGGNNGGDIKKYLDVWAPMRSKSIIIPHSGSADRTQEMTILIIHVLVMLIEREIAR